ncbi:hypothetical protein GE21DRAFT_1223764, partial [Neurospora crassa]
KKTFALKVLGVIVSSNKSEGKAIVEIIIFSAGPINLLYNNVLIKFITFKKIRKYLSKEI